MNVGQVKEEIKKQTDMHSRTKVKKLWTNWDEYRKNRLQNTSQRVLPTFNHTIHFLDGAGEAGWEKREGKKRRGKTVSWFWHSTTHFIACNSLLLHYNELCVFFWGADLTSTSYVYSSLVQDDSSRVVGNTAINSTISDLSIRDIQVTDHIAFRGDNLADTMTAILHNWIFIQCPSYCRQRSPLHIAHKGDWLSWTHDFLTKGRNDFGSSICQGKESRRIIVTRCKDCSFYPGPNRMSEDFFFLSVMQTIMLQDIILIIERGKQILVVKYLSDPLLTAGFFFILWETWYWLCCRKGIWIDGPGLCTSIRTDWVLA